MLSFCFVKKKNWNALPVFQWLENLYFPCWMLFITKYYLTEYLFSSPWVSSLFIMLTKFGYQNFYEKYYYSETFL